MKRPAATEPSARESEETGLPLFRSWKSVYLFVLGSFVLWIALLIASRARNTETVTGLFYVVQMPMFLLSGVFFSYARFPDFVQPAIRLLPLTALLDGMRAVMNEGAGFAAVAPQIGLLAATSVVSFVAGLKIFRWN